MGSRGSRESFRGAFAACGSSGRRKVGMLAGGSERKGQPLPVVDSLIAATAVVHGLAVVSRNASDFARCGLAYLNP